MWRTELLKSEGAGVWCLLLPVGLGADCWATELETWIICNAWLLATELVIWIWDNKNIYVLYCNACCYYNATVAFACLNWCNAATIMLLLLVWIDVWIGAKIRGGAVKICYWMSCFYASWNFGSFGKYRNRTELPETEVVRFLPLKRTDRYLLSRNRSSVGTEEPNRTEEPFGSVPPECPARMPTVGPKSWELAQPGAHPEEILLHPKS